MGAKNGGAALREYRKRTAFGPTNKKKADPQRELQEDLLAIDEISWEACWKIYRLEEDACDQHIPPQPKSRNCKQNPYCIHRLGLEKFDKLQQSPRGNLNIEILERRNPNVQPCGLVNYGNFCYVNSFLQIWFNDMRFRQCIYDWRPHPGWIKPPEAKLDIQAVIDCLQRLFLTLQFTPFEATDARDFIKLLRLDNEQQDVQEFHTLFFDTIERNLELHPNGEGIRNVIRRLFQSQIRQSTICGCGHSSEADSEYRSLPISIDGFNSLTSAIESFFQPEPLTDFKCNQCQQTGDTTKMMNYTILPQVLIIQLNRYVYDSAKEQHRKLKTAIAYPRILKANILKQDATYDDEYELCAVMIHVGQNTHCGHYYDLIRDPLSKNWFTFNDRQVNLEKSPPGFGGADNDQNEKTKATNDQKGCYALIYRRKSSIAETDEGQQLRLPPDDLVKELEDDFLQQSREGNRSKRLWEYRITNRHTYLNNLVRELEVRDGRLLHAQADDIAFLPTSLFTELYAKEYEAVKESISDVALFHEDESSSAIKTAADASNDVGQENQPQINQENGALDEKSQDQACKQPPNGILAASEKTNSNADRTHRSPSHDNSVFSFDGTTPKKEKNAENDNQVQNQQQLSQTTSDSSFDYAAYEHIYTPEPINDVHFMLCKHGNVPLDSIIRGQIKAVRTQGAQRLISEFNIRYFVHKFGEDCQKSQNDDYGTFDEIAPALAETNLEQPSTSYAAANSNADIARNEPADVVGSMNVEQIRIHSDSTINGTITNGTDGDHQEMPDVVEEEDNRRDVDRRLRTGKDICAECVSLFRNDATYRHNLSETMAHLSDTLKNMQKRTHDPNRDNSGPVQPPPDGAVWVSCDHLRRAKKIALDQQEKAGRLSMSEIGEPAEKRIKTGGGYDAETGEDMDTAVEQQSKEDIDNEIQIIHEDVKHVTVRKHITNRERDDEGTSNTVSPNDEDALAMAREEDDGMATARDDDQEGNELLNGRAESVAITDEEEKGTSNKEGPLKFNEDLYCKHGNLSSKTKRVWLTRAHWDELASNFLHYCDPFPCTAAECPECCEEDRNLNDVRESNLNQLQELVTALKPLLNKLHSRKWENNELGLTYEYVVCKEFVRKMRNILAKSKQKQVVDIPRICQECLLCCHGKPYMPLTTTEDPADIFHVANSNGFSNGGFFGEVGGRSQPQASGVPLMKPEWRDLVAAYRERVPEQPEPVKIKLLENGFKNFCDECFIQRQNLEASKRYHYPDGAFIFVKLKEDETEDQAQAKEANATSSPTNSSTRVVTRMTMRQKNVYKIKMRSDQTVRDLKVELIQKVKHSPVDQLLYMDDRVLNDAQTLEEAQVAGNNQEKPLILIVQHRQVQTLEADTEAKDKNNGGTSQKPRQLERGFTDTALSAL